MNDPRRLFARNKLLLIMCGVLAAVIALAYSLSVKPTYQASASLAFQDFNQQATLVGGASATLQTPAQLAAKSATVVTDANVLAQAAGQAHSGRRITDLRHAVSAAVDANSNLLVVTVTDHNAGQAAGLATAIARVAAATDNKEAQAQLRDDAATLGRRIHSIPQNAANLVTRQNEQANLSRLQTLSIVARPASVAQNADIPTSPTSPKVVFNTVLGGVLGLLIGLGLAAARLALDRRLRGWEEIESEIGVPILAQVDGAILGHTPANPDGKTDSEDGDAAIASFAILRRSVELLRLDSAPRTVAVTSAAPAEGKTTVATWLACAFANVGRRTVLIEADMRRPVLASRLNLPGGPGLGEYLSGRATAEEILRVVELPGHGRSGVNVNGSSLVCIPAGHPLAGGDEALASSRFREMLAEISEAYDAVVLDTSPLLPVADTMEILPHVDAFVLCVRSGQSTRMEVATMRSILERLPDRPSGAVITDISRGDQVGGNYEQYYVET